MRQLPSDKHTIAWFKLAEFVSRGEKERALGIYKLLILSIDDPAFAYKLEGDILYSFKDELAFEKYHKAVFLYQKDGKLTEAAAIYENLITLKPESIDYLQSLISLYEKLNFSSQINFNLKKLFCLKLKDNKIDKAQEILEKIETITSEILPELCEELSFAMINNKISEKNLILKQIQKTIDGYFLKNDRNALHKFLSKLEIIDNSIYLEAIKLVKE